MHAAAVAVVSSRIAVVVPSSVVVFGAAEAVNGLQLVSAEVSQPSARTETVVVNEVCYIVNSLQCRTEHTIYETVHNLVTIGVRKARMQFALKVRVKSLQNRTA